MEFIEITDPQDKNLEQFHRILIEAFPDPYGREDLHILKGNLESGSWRRGEEISRYHLLVVRDNDHIVAGTSFYFFSGGSFAIGIGAYLAVKKEFRRKTPNK